MAVTEKNFKFDLTGAVNLVLDQQGLVSISSTQYFQLECIVMGENSVHQVPTGSGKTWAAIRL
jgi:replicative superfamily II helicase